MLTSLKVISLVALALDMLQEILVLTFERFPSHFRIRVKAGIKLQRCIIEQYLNSETVESCF